jgi:hypothetical protein
MKALSDRIETLTFEEVMDVYSRNFDPATFVINTDK